MNEPKKYPNFAAFALGFVIAIAICILSSCATSNYGDPTRPGDAKKVKKEQNRAIQNQFGH